ncbi:hypothetical protein ACFQZE_16955 [Paenibacillus sp. GCM10027627]|uniref:hypothetical protein n=1 Tax=unclassified Paenibacillus TaxID=185978 RepID=UPI003645605F
MKFKKWLIVILMAAIWLTPLSVYAEGFIEPAKSGVVLGKAQKSGTQFFINGAQVPAVTFNNKLVVFTKDLGKYGFVSSWDNELRSITIKRNLKENTFKPVKDTTSAKPVDVKHTDITVLLDNRLVPSFYIGNGTAIYAEDLFRYGAISYDTKLKQQRLLLSKYALKDLPLQLMLSYDNTFSEVNIKTKNLSNVDLLEAGYDVYFYNRATKKVETYSTSIIGLDAKETSNWQSHDATTTVGDYTESYWKYVFLGVVFEATEDFEGNITVNPLYKEEQNYIKTKYLDYVQMMEKYRLSELSKELKANGNKPIKVTGVTIDHNSIGIPQPHISFKNLTNKTVDALEIRISCYDTFGREVTFPGQGNVFLGIAQDIIIPSGAENIFVWTLNLFENTTKVDVKVTNVHFTDGTSWKLK